MRVFVAGGTGVLGVGLVRELVARGHQVTALTRSPAKRAQIESLGAAAAVADALEAPALERAVVEAQPTRVVHLLTALPKGGPRRAGDVAATSRLRTEGTRNLVRAAIAAGATRIVGESFVFVYGLGDHGPSRKSEEGPMLPAGPDARTREMVEAMRSLEAQLLTAGREGSIEAVVLRFGLLYGPENPATRELFAALRRRLLPIVRAGEGLLPFVHDEDAVRATLSALEGGPSGGVYNVVDDQPIAFRDFVLAAADAAGAPRPFTVPRWLLRLLAPLAAAGATARLALSNERARRELDWEPRYPSVREGLEQTAQVLEPSRSSHP